METTRRLWNRNQGIGPKDIPRIYGLEERRLCESSQEWRHLQRILVLLLNRQHRKQVQNRQHRRQIRHSVTPSHRFKRLPNLLRTRTHRLRQPTFHLQEQRHTQKPRLHRWLWVHSSGLLQIPQFNAGSKLPLHRCRQPDLHLRVIANYAPLHHRLLPGNGHWCEYNQVSDCLVTLYCGYCALSQFEVVWGWYLWWW